MGYGNELERSFKSITTSPELIFAAIILSRSIRRMCLSHLGTLLVGKAFKFGQRTKITQSCVYCPFSIKLEVQWSFHDAFFCRVRQRNVPGVITYTLPVAVAAAVDLVEPVHSVLV